MMKRELAFALGARSLILDSVGKTRSNRAPCAHSNGGTSANRSGKRVKRPDREETVVFDYSLIGIEDSGIQTSVCDKIKEDLVDNGMRSRNSGIEIELDDKGAVSGFANGLLESKCETEVGTALLADKVVLDGSVARAEEPESWRNHDHGIEGKHYENTPTEVETREAIFGLVKTNCEIEVATAAVGSPISKDCSVVGVEKAWISSNGADGVKDNTRDQSAVNSNLVNDSPVQLKSGTFACVLGNALVEKLHETETIIEVAKEMSSVNNEVALINGHSKAWPEKPQRRFTRSTLKDYDKDSLMDLVEMETNLSTNKNEENHVSDNLNHRSEAVDVDDKDSNKGSHDHCSRLEYPQKVVEDLKQTSIAKIPRTVKELFETGILEGCNVYYNGGKKGSGLRGIIKGVGILCSCNLCQGSRVVLPSQFEIHACNSYRRASQYICFENGRSFLDILQLCRGTALKIMETTIRNAIGPLAQKEIAVSQECKEYSSMDTVADRDPLCKSRQKKMLPSENLHTPAGKTGGSPQKGPSSSRSIQMDKNSVGKIKASQKIKESTRTFSTPKTSLRAGRKKRSRLNKPIQAHNSCKGPSLKGSSQRKAGKITRKDLKMHRLVFDDAGLPDGTELAYFARGQRILEGYKKDSGIFCRCCNEVVSASQFEAHAGFATRRKPYSFIYTSNGVSLHELAVSLLKNSRRDVSESDDLCLICAEGGELLLCDGCPRAFHKECASLTHLPRGKWFCGYCQSAFERDRYVQWNVNAVAAGRVSGVDPIKQISNRSIRIVKDDFQDDATACYLCRSFDFSKSGFGPRTILICDQCEREYHVGCLKTHKMADLEDLPQGEWFCNTNCQMIRSSLQSLLNLGAEKLPDNFVDDIRHKFKAHNAEIPTDFDVSWRLLSGQVSSEAKATTRPLLSQAISVLHEGFGTIVDATTGRDIIPSIVYGRKVRNRDYRGMYCAVLLVNSLIVSVAVFRLFGQELVELPLVATRGGYRGKGFFQALFGCIEKLFRFHHVKSIVLPSAEDAEGVWLNFGFKRMTSDQVSECKKIFWQVTEFTGVVMLEKQLPNETATCA